MRTSWKRVAAALLLAAAAGCRRQADPVRETLEEIARAARGRDAAAVTARLSADYRDAAGNGRADIEQLLRGYFAAYEIVDVRIGEVAIERAEGAARVRFRADLSGQPKQASALAGLLPSSVSYDFDVRLAPEGGAWKVAWADWRSVSR